jgi:hypothetical protein
VASTTMSCMFGCRTDGMPLCADSCPTNQSLCGGSTCVDTYSTIAHCGPTCTQCKNSTPECYQGKCVQCFNNTECRDAAHTSLGFGTSAVCNVSTHLCTCATKDAGNVLTNPGFDTNLTGWQAGDTSSSISFAFSDGYFCGGSGSASATGFGGITQCARITGGQSYHFGVMYFLQGGATSPVGCSVEFHANSTCTDTAVGFSSFEGSASGWAPLNGTPTTAPSNATYAKVLCAQFEAGTVLVDQVYLNAANDSF